MKIILNADLQPVANEYWDKARAEYRAAGHKDFNDKFVGKTREIAAVDPDSRWGAPNAKVVRGIGDHERTQKGFAAAVAEAYSSHHGLVLHPHDIWYVVLSNIAGIVGNNPKAYQGLYTVSDSKQMLLVEQDHATDINIEALIAKLREVMPIDVDIFLPELSTATPAANVAMAAAVLDAAKSFYDYGMFCCGIPFIDLRGTKAEWRSLLEAAAAIVEETLKLKTAYNARPLIAYLMDIQVVLIDIMGSFDEDKTEFWKDIFTKENVGSGGDLKITGWITKLYHNVKNGDLIRSFHDTTSSFTYKNVTTGEHFIQFHGAFGSNLVDGALELAYDHVTVAYKPKA